MKNEKWTPCPGKNLPKDVDHWQVELGAYQEVPTGGEHLLKHTFGCKYLFHQKCWLCEGQRASRNLLKHVLVCSKIKTFSIMSAASKWIVSSRVFRPRPKPFSVLNENLRSTCYHTSTSYFLIHIDQKAIVLPLKHCNLPISHKASFREPEHKTNWLLNNISTSPFSILQYCTWDGDPRDFDHRTLPFQRAPWK